MEIITFKPKQVGKRLLTVLPDRGREVLIHRIGLGESTERKTLEAIGKNYGITRERVRQIENFALNTIRKSDRYEEVLPALTELRSSIYSQGAVLAEDDLLDMVARDASSKNYLMFLLILGEDFLKHKEDAHFRHRWSVDKNISEEVHVALRDLAKSLTEADLVPEEEMIQDFFSRLREVPSEFKNEDTARRWLSLSKVIRKNPLNDWGLATSPNINVRGIRDYAFLVIRRHGSPMHFKEVADAISTHFGRKAHVATCHNELIKDSRFVLVGRGLYALTDWGYASGVVRDVIRHVLVQNGPMTKEEIIEKVLRERYVKQNTVLVNLQDEKVFRRLTDGRFTLA